MIGFGLLGYLLRKLHIPLVPVILGMLLGPEMEKSLRHALTISDGDWTILWSSGLSVGIWAVAILGLVLPYLIGPVLRRRMAAAQDKDHRNDDCSVDQAVAAPGLRARAPQPKLRSGRKGLPASVFSTAFGRFFYTWMYLSCEHRDVQEQGLCTGCTVPEKCSCVFRISTIHGGHAAGAWRRRSGVYQLAPSF
jgi:hypothetical protein